MSLSINMCSASSDALDSPMSRAITHIAARITRHQQQGNIPTSPALNVTFMLPGKLDKPDFTGMRMGGFTDTDQTLYFEAAVPETLIQSRHAPGYVELALQDVVANANDFFRQNYRHFDQLAWQQMLTDLQLTA